MRAVPPSIGADDMERTSARSHLGCCKRPKRHTFDGLATDSLLTPLHKAPESRKPREPELASHRRGIRLSFRALPCTDRPLATFGFHGPPNSQHCVVSSKRPSDRRVPTESQPDPANIATASERAKRREPSASTPCTREHEMQDTFGLPFTQASAEPETTHQ